MRPLILALLLVCVSAAAQDNISVQSDKIQKPSVAKPQTDEGAAIKSNDEAASSYATAEGWAAMKRGDAETAIKLFNKAAGLNPHNADAYWGLGAAAAQQAKFEISSQAFDRARALDPKNPRLAADAGLAHTYSAMSQPKSSKARTQGLRDALARFDEALQLDPNFALTYANRAIALAYLGDYERAWEHIEKAESLDMTSVDPRLISYLSEKYPRPAQKPLPTAQATANSSPAAQPAQLAPTAAATPPAPLVQSMADAKPDAVAITAQPAHPVPAQAAQQASIPATLAAAAAITGSKPAPQPLIQQVALQEKQAEPAVLPEPDSKPVEKAVQEPAPVPTAEPAQDKKLKVISGTPAKQKGADKRHCLDLQTNEEIIRCVYPRR